MSSEFTVKFAIHIASMAKNISAAAEEFVTGLFEKYCPSYLSFHNLHHTVTVAKRAEEIAFFYDLNEQSTAQLQVSAYFHDTGFLFAPPQVHEEKSVEIATDWLTGRTDVNIDEIAGNIRATKYGAVPVTLSQAVLCDADTYHLGTQHFRVTDQLVYNEILNQHPGLTRQSFAISTLNMLTNHRFYTAYCISRLSEGKEKNITELKKRFSL